MSENFVGEIRMFAFAWAPMGWAICDGSTVPISQYSTLYSLLGTTFGGDGYSNFGLPDLRGRVPVGQGTSNLGVVYPYSLKGGSEQVSLNVSNLPGHTHLVNVSSQQNSQTTPKGNYLSAPTTSSRPRKIYNEYVNNLAVMDARTVSYYGVAQPLAHNNMQPTLVLSYCIALDGYYPTRP